jgi:hypothetical protein
MDEHLELWALMLSLAGTMLLTDALKNLLSGLSNFGPLACFFIGLGLLYAAMRIKKRKPKGVADPHAREPAGLAG